MMIDIMIMMVFVTHAIASIPTEIMFKHVILCELNCFRHVHDYGCVDDLLFGMYISSAKSMSDCVSYMFAWCVHQRQFKLEVCVRTSSLLSIEYVFGCFAVGAIVNVILIFYVVHVFEEYVSKLVSDSPVWS